MRPSFRINKFPYQIRSTELHFDCPGNVTVYSTYTRALDEIGAALFHTAGRGLYNEANLSNRRQEHQRMRTDLCERYVTTNIHAPASVSPSQIVYNQPHITLVVFMESQSLLLKGLKVCKGLLI